MKYLFRFTLLALMLVMPAAFAAADEYDETRRLFENAGLTAWFEKAYGYALFPTIGKGGFFVGGAYGEGRVYEQGQHVGYSSMIQASIGFQMGGTGFSQVVFFENQQAFAEFVSGSFEFEAEAQATVLTAAAGASASTGGSSAVASGTKNSVAISGAGYSGGMATFTITKGGLMYEASVGGQKFSFKRL